MKEGREKGKPSRNGESRNRTRSVGNKKIIPKKQPQPGTVRIDAAVPDTELDFQWFTNRTTQMCRIIQSKTSSRPFFCSHSRKNMDYPPLYPHLVMHKPFRCSNSLDVEGILQMMRRFVIIIDISRPVYAMTVFTTVEPVAPTD